MVNKPAQSHFYEKCYDVPGQADPCDGGVIKSATRNYYDNATSPDVIVPDKGRLTRQEKGEGSVWEDTRYSYAPNGNLLKVERMDGGVVRSSMETFYDPRFRVYPVCTKNILGHTTQQRYYGVPGSIDAGCTTTAGSNLPVTGGFFGQLEQAIDENGQGTTLQYDGLGRIWRVIRPGDSTANPTVRFSYTAYSGANAPFWIKKEQRENLSSAGTGEYLETRTFYDGFGRVLQTQAEAASASQSIVASTEYNAAGQVLQQNAPYFHPAALGGYRTRDWGKPKTATTYDAYGRAKQVTNPDNSKTCTYYQGLQTAVVYEQTAGATYTYFQKISATDQLGRLASVKDYMGTVGNNPGAACPAPFWTANPNGTTSYQYDVADRLTTTTAPDNAQIQITYDALGRKTQMIDPDMGTWTYAYDQVSNLTRQTDARGQTVCFYYDGLSRLRGKHTRTDLNCPTWSSNPTLAAQYTYDAGSNGIGRRTGMTDGSGSASEGVTFSYTAQGPLKGVSGTSVYVGDTLYNELGQVTDRYLGSTTGVIRQRYTYTQAENFRLRGGLRRQPDPDLHLRCLEPAADRAGRGRQQWNLHPAQLRLQQRRQHRQLRGRHAALSRWSSQTRRDACGWNHRGAQEVLVRQQRQRHPAHQREPSGDADLRRRKPGNQHHWQRRHPDQLPLRRRRQARQGHRGQRGHANQYCLHRQLLRARQWHDRAQVLLPSQRPSDVDRHHHQLERRAPDGAALLRVWRHALRCRWADDHLPLHRSARGNGHRFVRLRGTMV